MPDDMLRGSLVRHLETDLLLGVRAVPLSVPAPSRSSPTATPPQPQHPADGRASVTNHGATQRASAPAPQGVPPELRRQAGLSENEIAQRREALRQLDEQEVKPCTRCHLCRTRTKTVFGQGHPAARLVFVGEAPGRDEDLQGLAFVGKAGQLLSRMIEAMGLSRDDVFICNTLKCRPPENRTPAPDEIAACWPFLDRQLQIIQPEVIVALGKPASQTLLRTTESIGRLRGLFHDYHISGMPMVGKPTPLMPTFHPAYLLRDPSEKGKAWSDLKQVMALLGLPLPA
ncbi:MAG TPA: uracil-DNA glycosylase [Phycisphaerae bacterium]|nr:uracil-DNA glycosylase [Phycisphaerae bacterium]HRY71039.1 uracil-DNA glycosylase [Phycisphaerae bacterium]HSA29349.1 uracil-DNA glycosylase [Phycisphaerae bacterium]